MTTLQINKKTIQNPKTVFEVAGFEHATYTSAKQALDTHKALSELRDRAIALRDISYRENTKTGRQRAERFDVLAECIEELQTGTILAAMGEIGMGYDAPSETPVKSDGTKSTLRAAAPSGKTKFNRLQAALIEVLRTPGNETSEVVTSVLKIFGAKSLSGVDPVHYEMFAVALQAQLAMRGHEFDIVGALAG